MNTAAVLNTSAVVKVVSRVMRKIDSGYSGSVVKTKIQDFYNELICNDLCQEANYPKQGSPQNILLSYARKVSGKSPGISLRHWPL